jgi:tartrate dehydratase beta subunit/fumarate hydratase class I family protein
VGSITALMGEMLQQRDEALHKLLAALHKFTLQLSFL